MPSMKTSPPKQFGKTEMNANGSLEQLLDSIPPTPAGSFRAQGGGSYGMLIVDIGYNS